MVSRDVHVGSTIDSHINSTYGHFINTIFGFRRPTKWIFPQKLKIKIFRDQYKEPVDIEKVKI